MGQNGVELACETVQLTVGQGEPGQSPEPFAVGSLELLGEVLPAKS